jgi:transposase
MEDWPGGIPVFQIHRRRACMPLFVGIDVSKDKFDACGIGERGEKVFVVSLQMNKQGFEDLLLRLPKKNTASLLFGMESTASYHIALFSYLTAQGYQVAIINPLLIANFAKLSLRKTKTDKKDAFTIAKFIMLQREAIVQHKASLHFTELRDLSRRREKLVNQMTAIKNNIKRVLSVIFPELETITGVFTKSTLRLLSQYPSARAIQEAGCDAVADIFIDRSKGNRPRATITTLMETASSSVGVASPAKELIVRQEAASLLHLEEQTHETTKLLKSLCNENMKKDMDILTSMKGIGEKTAMNFLVEMGGDIRAYENDKKLIAAAGLDPSTYQSGKYERTSRISKKGNRHLRRVIWLMTRRVITSNELFRAHYFKRKTGGLPYKMAVLATAHKLIRVMYAMLKHQTYFEKRGN